jgi:shikimate kinase
MTGPAHKAQKVLLIGMMGSGKTTVGAALSSRLGWPYLDNDVMLERTTGQTAEDILRTDGEQALRVAESRVLTFMLGMPTSIVAGVAAGVVLEQADRERLASSDAHVVWLRASTKVLARRVGGGAGRPKLGNDVEASLRKLAADRNPFYEQVAAQVIDVDALAPGVVAKMIVEELAPPA